MGFLLRYRMASAVSGSFVEFQAGIMELSAPPMVHIVDNSIETMSADSYPASPSSGYSSPGTYLPFPNKPLGFDVFDNHSHQAIFCLKSGQACATILGLFLRVENIVKFNESVFNNKW